MLALREALDQDHSCGGDLGNQGLDGNLRASRHVGLDAISRGQTSSGRGPDLQDKGSQRAADFNNLLIP